MNKKIIRRQQFQLIVLRNKILGSFFLYNSPCGKRSLRRIDDKLDELDIKLDIINERHATEFLGG